MVTEEVQKTLNIDKSDWTPVKLGDVVQEVRETVKDPATEGIDRIIGLEHIESENIHIKSWGQLTEGTTFTKVFRKGQVLFGRRRAYLKKAAIATFDGICSGDITVLEAKKGLLPELLPFLIQNDKFFDLAIQNSAGSLSPRAKFKDLADYEFLLPPKEQQAQIAELLWAADEAVESKRRLEEELYNFANSLFDSEIFDNQSSSKYKLGYRNSKWPVKELGEFISQLQYGISEQLDENTGIPILRMNNLNNGKLNTDDLKYFTPLNGELENFILNKGDILFNRTNSFELVGKVCLFDVDGIYSFASYLIRIKVDTNLLDPRFLNFYLNTSIGMAEIRKYRTPGVSQSNINAQNIKKFLVPIPPIESQLKIIERIEAIQNSSNKANTNLISSTVLQKSLINQFF